MSPLGLFWSLLSCLWRAFGALLGYLGSACFPKGSQGAPWGGFGEDLGWIWSGFGEDLGLILRGFGVEFCAVRWLSRRRLAALTR